MNKQYFDRKIWDTIHYITVLYRNDSIHYTYCIVPTLVCVCVALVLFFLFRAPIVVARPPLPPLRFAFPPALSSPPPPPSPSVPFLSSPAPSPSLCGGFAGARTQAPSFYARMLLCFGAGTHVHSSSFFPDFSLFSCFVPLHVPSLVACSFCCLCLLHDLSSFVCLSHARKLLLLRMQFATLLISFVLHSCRTLFMRVSKSRHRGERRSDLSPGIPASVYSSWVLVCIHVICHLVPALRTLCFL